MKNLLIILEVLLSGKEFTTKTETYNADSILVTGNGYTNIPVHSRALEFLQDAIQMQDFYEHLDWDDEKDDTVVVNTKTTEVTNMGEAGNPVLDRQEEGINDIMTIDRYVSVPDGITYEDYLQSLLDEGWNVARSENDSAKLFRRKDYHTLEVGKSSDEVQYHD